MDHEISDKQSQYQRNKRVQPSQNEEDKNEGTKEKD